MIDINTLFSQQEQRVYKKFPLATAFFLIEEDLTPKLLLVSDTMCSFFGIEKKALFESLNSELYKNTHPDDLDKLSKATYTFIHSKNKVYDLTYRHLSQITNTYVWIRAKGYSLDLDYPATVAMLTYQNVDIQMKRSLVEEALHLNNKTEYDEMQNMLQAIVQQQNDFVLKLDKKTQKAIVFASNHNLLNLSEGYHEMSFPAFDHRIKTYIHVLETYGKSFSISCQSLINSVKQQHYATTYKIKDQDQISYKRLLFFRDSSAHNVFVLASDVTDIVTIEHQKREALQKANNTQTAFLSRMSHDMRTPLGAVIATADFGLDESHEPHSRNYFEQIKTSSEYLLALMNDILDVQKLNSDHLILTPTIFNIASLNQSVKNILHPKIAKKNIQLKITTCYTHETPYIKFDQQHLEQLLINLLNNAIKYTPINGTIFWDCCLESQASKTLLKYRIKDTGVGISPAFQKHMFEPFTKEQNTLSATEGGTGLGLSIVKSILDCTGGTIDCLSDLGKGTQFTITIPVHLVSQSQIDEIENQSSIYNECFLKGKHILLAEDVFINQKIATKILEEKGLIVSIAQNGLEAIEKVRNHTYDAVLMDIRMPVMNGLTASKEIRKFDPRIPIIALSANTYLKDIQLSLDAGMNAHLSKPINQKKLMEVLLDCLETPATESDAFIKKTFIEKESQTPS